MSERRDVRSLPNSNSRATAIRAEAGLSLDGSPGGALLGLQVRIHWSWSIIMGLLTWGLATAYYPSAMPAWSRAADWIAGLLTSGLFFASVLLHEMAHSLVARHLGGKVITSAEAALAMMNARRVNQLAVLMPNRAPQLLTLAALLEGMRSRIELASTARRSAAGGA